MDHSSHIRRPVVDIFRYYVENSFAVAFPLFYYLDTLEREAFSYTARRPRLRGRWRRPARA
jgi:hypothetical protein